ncbi:MAG: SprT-like domain-containing protein [Chitinophagaceae bacterium]
MAKQESPFDTLRQYMPNGSFDAVMVYFEKHSIHLTLTETRKTRLGDYRSPAPGQHFHKISVNATLNQYSFLVTLLHEIAHLTTYVAFKNKVAPHGAEWKAEFKNVLEPFIGKKIFPKELDTVLRAYLKNPAASTCADPNLFKALRRYDPRAASLVHVDEIPDGAKFELEGRLFEKISQLRTRARCKDLKTGRLYFVQGVALVTLASGKLKMPVRVGTGGQN